MCMTKIVHVYFEDRLVCEIYERPTAIVPFKFNSISYTDT
jgi:hypothetical protein